MSHLNGDDPTIEFETSDLLVFSHLRWNFVYQRPQHLMSRFARVRRVFFFEEPVFEHAEEPSFQITSDRSGVRIIVPHLPFEYSPESIEIALSQAVDELISSENVEDYTVWYYTPMALAFTRHLDPRAGDGDLVEPIGSLDGPDPAAAEFGQDPHCLRLHPLGGHLDGCVR